jgi:hypothetical protein
VLGDGFTDNRRILSQRVLTHSLENFVRGLG